MGRYTGPKHKLSRREGIDVFGNGGESLARRLDQPPGAHGRERTRQVRDTAYAQQLREKQKVKRMYGMREQQFHRFFALAQRTPGMTGVALLTLLERRLDNVVYRLGWARTRAQARQYVNHGHVLVDGKPVNIPSYLVDIGQTVGMRNSLQRMLSAEQAEATLNNVPEWLDMRDGRAHVLRAPHREEIDGDIDEQRIVEFYSR